MGCLDPVVNKERTFELLRKKGATKAVLEFSGGHDEGNVESIVLFHPDALGGMIETELKVWYCGGYRVLGGGKYQRISEHESEDDELSELLQGPIDAEFGTWASVEYTSGVLTWDVEAGTAKMEYAMDEPIEHEQEW